MTNIIIGFPRSGTHWVGNIVNYFSKEKVLQLHEKYRNDLNYFKCIYIKRHPAGIIESSMRCFSRPYEDINILDRWKVGKWKDHINSWKNALNTLYINYEDILDQPLIEFKKILDWFNIPYIEFELKKAIEYYSIENVKSRGEEPSPKGSWKGKNNWREVLSEEFIKQIKKELL